LPGTPELRNLAFIIMSDC